LRQPADSAMSITIAIRGLKRFKMDVARVMYLAPVEWSL
jgi:hypothetical protein